MRLRIFEPSRIFLDTEITKVIGESLRGSFTLLPRHLDMATALAPGILLYETGGGAENYLALDRGILVKEGEVVSIATRTAVRGELGALRAAVDQFITEVDEKEKKARSAVARLEADFVRRFVEFGKNV